VTIDLDKLVAEMRRLGVTRLKTPELELDLGPAPAAAQPVVEKRDSDLPSTDEVDINKDERAWNRMWKMATRSSGAPIPPFPRKRVNQ
jgi:hypothetical protein